MFCCARPKVDAARYVSRAAQGYTLLRVFSRENVPYRAGRTGLQVVGAGCLGLGAFFGGSWGLVGGRGERTGRTRAFIRRQYGAHGPPATASAKVRRRPGEKARPRAVAGLGQCYSDW